MDGPAARAGFQKGDIILRVGDTDITSAKQFDELIAQNSIREDGRACWCVAARTRSSCRCAHARSAEIRRRRGIVHALRARVVPSVRRHARRARTDCGGVRRGSRVDRRRHAIPCSKRVTTNCVPVLVLRWRRVVPLPSRRSHACARRSKRAARHPETASVRHWRPARKKRRPNPVSAKMLGFSPIFKACSAYCPGAPFSLDRH